MLDLLEAMSIAEQMLINSCKILLYAMIDRKLTEPARTELNNVGEAFGQICISNPHRFNPSRSANNPRLTAGSGYILRSRFRERTFLSRARARARYFRPAWQHARLRLVSRK